MVHIFTEFAYALFRKKDLLQDREKKVQDTFLHYGNPNVPDLRYERKSIY